MNNSNNGDRKRWTDERLDRFADTVDVLRTQVESSTRNIDSLREISDSNTKNIESLRTQVESSTRNIESLRTQVESSTRNIESLRTQVESSTRNIESLRELSDSNTKNIDILVGIVTGHQEQFATILKEIQDIKAEIRGLQTENRRILDRLFRQQEDE